MALSFVAKQITIFFFTKSFKALTPKFINALDEIFTYFDKDADGILSDDEMQHLSMIVWNEELKNDTLLNIKDVLFKEEYVYIILLLLIQKKIQKKLIRNNSKFSSINSIRFHSLLSQISMSINLNFIYS